MTKYRIYKVRYVEYPTETMDKGLVTSMHIAPVLFPKRPEDEEVARRNEADGVIYGESITRDDIPHIIGSKMKPGYGFNIVSIREQGVEDYVKVSGNFRSDRGQRELDSGQLERLLTLIKKRGTNSLVSEGVDIREKLRYSHVG